MARDHLDGYRDGRRVDVVIDYRDPIIPASELSRQRGTRDHSRGDEVTELQATCECDRYQHADTPCPREPAVVASPALCTPCLFVCWADDDDEEFQ